VSENTQLAASPGAISAANGAFASMASGRPTVVPGTWIGSDALIGFGWPAVSDTLAAELSFTTRAQLASWRPGAARLAVAADRPGLTAGSLVVN
jgi:hypothetical protein